MAGERIDGRKEWVGQREKVFRKEKLNGGQGGREEGQYEGKWN